MNLRTIAKITGWSLVAMAVVSGVSLGYAYEEVFQSIQNEPLQNAAGHFRLFRIVLLGLFLTVILDFTVSFTFYKFFETDNRIISLISMILRITYTLMLVFAALSLLDCRTIWTTDRAGVVANFERFMFIWTGGLIIFGFHLTLIGFLMKMHKKIPKILWILTLMAGLSYIIVHLLKIIPSLEQLAKSLETILMLPMAAGELGLAIWLIVKGGKNRQASF
ncbi:MAG: DUF4386 domain-containing protein [Tannerella sp.]|jgi:hypothetical protein|nr:DUF4386 domain-containing protein [Tannerella sp.]